MRGLFIIITYEFNKFEMPPLVQILITGSNFNHWFKSLIFNFESVVQI